LLWTRYELDAQKYGYEDEKETPTVPQDELTPPSTEPTGQEGQEGFLELTESDAEVGSDIPASDSVDDILKSSGVGAQKKPLGREVTTRTAS
jgi:hypothetical protein